MNKCLNIRKSKKTLMNIYFCYFSHQHKRYGLIISINNLALFQHYCVIIAQLYKERKYARF